MRHLLLLTVSFVFLTLVRPSAQAAQPATSFAELPALLQTDTQIVLTLASGERVQGRVDAVEAARLSIRDRDRVRWLGAANIARIDRRMPDSIANGLLIGAAIGAGIFLGYYSENALCSYNCQFLSGAFASIGIGAGAGMAIDALVVKTTTVYEHRDGPPAAVILLGVKGAARSVAVRLTF